METLHLYNARTQRLEAFIPSDPNDVKIYCCGPTVYNVPHLGHARTYVFLDVLRRMLRYYLGFGVRTVMNITDLNDKIIEIGGLPSARKFESKFFDTMDQLNVERPDFAPRVTDFMYLMNNFSKRCLVSKFAYYSNGFDTTYFSTEAYLKKFDRVFPLSEKRDNSLQQSTLEQNEGKWDVRDFAIWKNSKEWIDVKGEKQTEMPGWHTECATIASFFFSDSVDIHLGGIDLQFPHHENEIALGRVYFENKDWVNFCLYTGHLQTEGKKMSKSLQNFTTVEQMVEDGFSPLAIRYMFMKFPYDKPMTFHKDELKKAQKAYDNFMHHIQRMKLQVLELERKATESDFEDIWYDEYGSKMELSELSQVKKKVDEYLKDNLNVGKALETLEDYVQGFSHPLKQDLPYDWLRYCLTYILWMTDTCFGLIEKPPKEDESSDALFLILKKFRAKVREMALTKDMEETQKKSLLTLCDNIREEINGETHYNIEDE